jgi:3',5'-cyclic AMP phosphodiesterase CpdA
LAFTFAHVSDLHVSTFGDTLHDRGRLTKRSARVSDAVEPRFEVCWEEAGWRVMRARGSRKRSDVVLVDLQGYAHPVPTTKEAGGLLDPVERAAAKACRLEARRDATLAASPPGEGALAQMLETTPHNTNLRCLRAARAVLEAGVDAVALTGDATDDGSGWELVESAFDRWRGLGRFFPIPGNHDMYLFPIASSERPRPTHESKRTAWREVAARAGLAIEACGAWKRVVPEADAIFVGLDSCFRKQRAFYRQNGAIGPEQLAWLKELAATADWKGMRHRIAMVHHHVVSLPVGVGKRAPTEIGMRLDDAKALAETLHEVGATLVMHGHRHVSEHRHPAGTDFELLAAPSLTLGCKSGDVPSFWRVELDHRVHVERVRVPVEAVEQENDPGTEPPPSPD